MRSERIMTIIVDNASSNDLAFKYLKQILNLWDGSVPNDEFLHMRCVAHILNLVVKDGLKDVDVYVIKVCAAMKYVRSSPARLQKFKACVEEEKINSKFLVCLDIETRWNSTFSMLKSALVFKKTFKNLKTKYLPYTKELRKIFYEATLSFSGSRYVTGNTFVEEIYDIGYTINRYVDDLNGGVKKIRKLKGTNLRKDYETEIESNNTSETTTELDIYLGDKCVRDNDSFDILAWWSVQTNNYPILMSMARDILAISVCTVVSESTFSIGGRVLDSFPTSLTPRFVEALVCT
ncbi:hypothetical protein GQ457_05G015320 [Hibiscus cannabinus]